MCKREGRDIGQVNTSRLDPEPIHGASGAHRATRLQERLELVAAPRGVDPYGLADQAMDEWEDLWTARGAAWTALPGDAASWPQLPQIDGQDVRTALLTLIAGPAGGYGP